MKALWHAECSTIISPPADGKWVGCRCGGAACRWRNPTRGLFELAERGDAFRSARVIGFHNGWLLADREAGATPMASDEWERRTAEILEATPDSYLFKRRHCPVVIIAPGETGDTFRMPWADYEGSLTGNTGP